MPRRPRTTFFLTFLTFLSILLFAAFFLQLSRHAVSGDHLRWYPDSSSSSSPNITLSHHLNLNLPAVTVPHNHLNKLTHQTRHVSSIKDSIPTVSVLLPDWEILVLVSPHTPFSLLSGHHYQCLFHNNAKSPAKFSGLLPFTDSTTFKCTMPHSTRRCRFFSQPILTKASHNQSPSPSPTPQLLRWNYLVYESFSTRDDVVLFVKGVNQRQGKNRSPNNFMCVFGDAIHNAVRTPVTSSVQEVFRCPHPNASKIGDQRIGISLEIVGEKEVVLVPSVAYYMRKRKIANPEPQHLLCACTMVYNVAKFLREWVMYHSQIGVEKFILYDNGSEDELERVIEELKAQGYNVSRVFWIWPKTQEAGFSHSVVYSKEWCKWMMYVDVDEFVFSPTWRQLSQPSNQLLKSLLWRCSMRRVGGGGERRLGQVRIRCNEFGPSGQRVHPVEGVTQGYTCRRRNEQRHKSIVKLEAVERGLVNVIHHFKLKKEYRSKRISTGEGLVNHYKYQAWPEFKTKFKRRVSAYVADWGQAVNPKSRDRTPGLGFQPIEPKGWPQKFCEVRDETLKLLTLKWFGYTMPDGYRMAWQT